MQSQDGEQNGLMGRVDEGVDEFFSKKVTKMDKSVLKWCLMATAKKFRGKFSVGV